MTIEYRQASAVDGDETTLVGLVTPFDTETVIGDLARGGFYEKVNRGAFTKTLREQDVALIHDHNTGWLLARTSVPDGEGALDLRPDPTAGLRCKATPLQTTVGLDVLRMAAKKVLRGMSFGFEVIKDRWTDDEGRASNSLLGTHREILEVRLHEVTTTGFPAYKTSELSARGMGGTEELLRQRAAHAAGGSERAAAASYSDLHTCAECGATGQYDAYCTGCGEPMTSPASSAQGYCGQCGAALDGGDPGMGAETARSAHECKEGSVAEARDEVDGDHDGDEVFRLWAQAGNLAALKGKKLAPQIQAAVQALLDYQDSLAEQVGATDSHGDVKERSEPAAATPEEDEAASLAKLKGALTRGIYDL